MTMPILRHRRRLTNGSATALAAVLVFLTRGPPTAVAGRRGPQRRGRREPSQHLVRTGAPEPGAAPRRRPWDCAVEEATALAWRPPAKQQGRAANPRSKRPAEGHDAAVVPRPTGSGRTRPSRLAGATRQRRARTGLPDVSSGRTARETQIDVPTPLKPSAHALVP